jgi:hypothetical protein
METDQLKTIPSTPSLLSVMGERVLVPVLWMSLGAILLHFYTKKPSERSTK